MLTTLAALRADLLLVIRTPDGDVDVGLFSAQ